MRVLLDTTIQQQEINKMGKKDEGIDYDQILSQQQGENRAVVRDQTYANRPTQYTPWGANSWESYESIDPSTGEPVTQWTNTLALTPELQAINNKQIAIQGGRTDVAGMLTNRMGNEFNQTMDWSGLSPMGGVPAGQYTRPEGDIGNAYERRQAAEDAVYGQAMSRIAPQQEGQRASLELQMRNQGLNPEDAAWQSQMETQGQTFNDQNNQALWSANQAGMQESNSMYDQLMGQNQNTFNQNLGANAQNYGQAMGNSAYASQIRQQQMTEQMQQRGFSLNEINALLSGQQVGMPGMPDFSQAESAQPVDYVGAGAAQASAAAASNPTSALIGAAGTIGGGMMGGPMGAALGAKIAGTE